MPKEIKNTEDEIEEAVVIAAAVSCFLESKTGIPVLRPRKRVEEWARRSESDFNEGGEFP